MLRNLGWIVVVLAAILPLAGAVEEAQSLALPWRVIIANDNCPDVTWGFTEAETRQAFADLITAHLDEMKRTDAGRAENRNHYNATAFIEVESFLEKYPERTEELLRRIREGRLYVSPFLCNSLWGWQSPEGVVRTFYPARRFERAHAIPFEVAEHIELPSLPWGMATLLAGCGVRWLSVPFYDYDSRFEELANPPVFRFEGPDGSTINVLLDSWASLRASYAQGSHLLKDPRKIEGEWLPHYAALGAAWPLRVIFASGTHSDISPESGKQARVFADAIIAFNETGNRNVRLVNGTLPQFCSEVDRVERAAPFLPTLRGCFGHTWETWPVSLASIAAAAREGERAYLVAESLVALAGGSQPQLASSTRADRQRAEWLWAMLSDHAWNGTDPENRRHNAGLRRGWAEELSRISRNVSGRAWKELGLTGDRNVITVFNPLSFPRDIFVECDAPEGTGGVQGLPSSLRRKDDGKWQVAFLAPRVPPFGFREFRMAARSSEAPEKAPFSGERGSLDGPFYRLAADLENGGLKRLVHMASGQDLVFPGSGRSLCQTVFNDGTERLLSQIECRSVTDGTTGELRITGRIGEIQVATSVRLYAALDRVDFEVRIDKPPTVEEQRLLHFFPIVEDLRDLRIETTAAVVRPIPQPEGDLLPGADTRRFAVQGFIDASPRGRVGATVANLDSFLLRLDQGAPAFQALGNDQNWNEVTRDQDGVTRFRFRYSLRAHPEGYHHASAVAWSRNVTTPSTFVSGRILGQWLNRSHLELDPGRALALCFKPSEDGDPARSVVRLWETAGSGAPVLVKAYGFKAATESDLLERNRGALQFQDGEVRVPVRPHGLAAVELVR